MRVRFAQWTFDSDARELRRGDELVHITPKAFRLLELLIASRPAAVPKEEITDAVWPATHVAESNLASIVKELRAAMGDDARQSQFVRTVHGFGYAFSGEAVEVPRTKHHALDSIAVLPFVNEGGSDSQHVSDGVTESLINALSRNRRWRVVPRSTVVARGTSILDWQATARRLSVATVLTGRVFISHARLRISASLLAVEAGTQLWGDSFDDTLADLQSIESAIVAAVSKCLQPAAGAAIPQRHAANHDAYDHYLRGRLYWNRRDGESFRRAVEEFQSAINRDRTFGAAYGALAEAYVVFATRELVAPREVFPVARETAIQALRIEPALASAQCALASIAELYDWDWDGAESAHREAIALDPYYDTAMQWLALHYARRGRHDEARERMTRALEIEPLSPILLTNAAFIAYLRRDFGPASDFANIALELHPFFEAGQLVRGIVLIQLDAASAVTQLEDLARLSKRQPYVLANLASAYAAAGRIDDARAIESEIRNMATTRYVSAAIFALTELATGQREQAIASLEAAAVDRSPWLSYVKTEPRLDCLRDAERFRAIERRIAF